MTEMHQANVYAFDKREKTVKVDKRKKKCKYFYVYIRYERLFHFSRKTTVPKIFVSAACIIYCIFLANSSKPKVKFNPDSFHEHLPTYFFLIEL